MLPHVTQLKLWEVAKFLKKPWQVQFAGWSFSALSILFFLRWKWYSWRLTVEMLNGMVENFVFKGLSIEFSLLLLNLSYFEVLAKDKYFFEEFLPQICVLLF